MSSGEYGHALTLSSKIGSRVHSQVLARFLSNSLHPQDPINTLYQLQNGRQPSSSMVRLYSSSLHPLSLYSCSPLTAPNVFLLTALGAPTHTVLSSTLGFCRRWRRGGEDGGCTWPLFSVTLQTVSSPRVRSLALVITWPVRDSSLLVSSVT